MERKALSKRLRFEIFKRDGFRCTYCGITPVNSVLHVDHVKPVAAGGTDDPSNLITACSDCNGGKSSIPLEQRKLKSSFTSEEEKEHAEQIREYLQVQREIADAKRDAEALVLDRWRELMGEWHYTLPRFIPGAIKDHGLPTTMEAVEITSRKGLSSSSAVRYFCGVLRKRREGGFEAEQKKKAAEDVRDAGWKIAFAACRSYWLHRVGELPPDEFNAIVRRALGVGEGGTSPLEWKDFYQLIEQAAWSSMGEDGEPDHDLAWLRFSSWAAQSIADGEVVDEALEHYSPTSYDRHIRSLCHHDGWEGARVLLWMLGHDHLVGNNETWTQLVPIVRDMVEDLTSLQAALVHALGEARKLADAGVEADHPEWISKLRVSIAQLFAQWSDARLTAIAKWPEYRALVD